MKRRLARAIREFNIERQTLCLCTVSEEGQPQCSLVHFAVNGHSDILFFSKEETRKSRNIEKNPKVSMLLSNESKEEILQIEGVAERINNEGERRKAFALIRKATKRKLNWINPAGKIFGGELVLYKVYVTWAQLGHFKKGGSELFDQLFPDEAVSP